MDHGHLVGVGKLSFWMAHGRCKHSLNLTWSNSPRWFKESSTSTMGTRSCYTRNMIPHDYFPFSDKISWLRSLQAPWEKHGLKYTKAQISQVSKNSFWTCFGCTSKYDSESPAVWGTARCIAQEGQLLTCSSSTQLCWKSAWASRLFQKKGIKVNHIFCRSSWAE